MQTVQEPISTQVMVLVGFTELMEYAVGFNLPKMFFMSKRDLVVSYIGRLYIYLI